VESVKLAEFANLMEKFLPPGQTPFISWAWRLWYGIFPLPGLG